MDIFDYALQMEKDGELFYLKLAKKTGNKGLQNILEMLAEEEVKHYKAIEGMMQGRCEMSETAVLDNAKNIFVEMKDRGEKFEQEKDQTEFYAKAQAIEKQSQQFYEEKACKATEQNQKKLFEKLAGEEAKHYFLLENIIEFVSRPKQWLEDAEWYHLEQY